LALIYARTASSTSRLAVALVAGGALGNLVDRLRFSYVVDFIHVRYWPVFNVADIAIVAGAGLLLIASFASRAAH